MENRRYREEDIRYEGYWSDLESVVSDEDAADMDEAAYEAALNWQPGNPTTARIRHWLRRLDDQRDVDGHGMEAFIDVHQVDYPGLLRHDGPGIRDMGFVNPYLDNDNDNGNVNGNDGGDDAGNGDDNDAANEDEERRQQERERRRRRRQRHRANRRNRREQEDEAGAQGPAADDELDRAVAELEALLQGDRGRPSARSEDEDWEAELARPQWQEGGAVAAAAVAMDEDTPERRPERTLGSVVADSEDEFVDPAIEAALDAGLRDSLDDTTKHY